MNPVIKTYVLLTRDHFSTQPATSCFLKFFKELMRNERARGTIGTTLQCRIPWCLIQQSLRDRKKEQLLKEIIKGLDPKKK